MTTLLAIDTSTEACSVALLNQNEITHDFIISQRDHTKQILPMVDRILSQSDCSLSQIDAIVFGKGPGSFTGIRIGIGVAQGLAFGINKPLIGVSSLMTLAQGAYRLNQANQVISAIDARMNEVYFGAFQRNKQGIWNELTAECVIKPETVKQKISALTGDFYSAGTGWQTYPNMADHIIKTDVFLPQAQDMLIIAQDKWAKQQLIMVEDVEPTYLRNEVTWKKLPGRE